MRTLHYDGSLLLRLPEEETDAFAASSFFKISLKRYVGDVSSGLVRFKPALTYLDYKRVIDLCQREADKQQAQLIVSEPLKEYIEQKEMHLEVRSRLGIELKGQDDKLLERFHEYENVVNQGMARKLREKQMWDSFFMCTMKKSANFSVPGSGKTASVLGMYAYLHQKGLVKRILVICPKNAFGSWIDEFKVCFQGIEELNVFNIHDPKYKSTVDRNRALQYEIGGCNLILVNYESVSNVLSSLESIAGQQTLLAFDEVHKVKRVNGEYASNSLKVAQKANYVVAMTGTPLPNSYLDIYNLLHILFPDEYDEFFHFSTGMLRKPRPDEMQKINDSIQPFFCRTTKEQLCVPPANPDRLDKMQATEDETRLLNILKMKYKKKKLALLIRLLQFESNPEMLLHALDLKDFSYLVDDNVDIDEIDVADFSEEVKRLIDHCKKAPTKFKYCVDLALSLAEQGKPVIIWCIFVDSIDRIATALRSQGIAAKCIYGEVPLEDRLTILQEFREGKIQVLLTNPHTLAESVSLHSVCHDAIYFEYSYNLVHLLQSKDRIHRLGLPDGQYTQYDYLQVFYDTDDSKWSLDEEIYNRLRKKEKIMLDAIANRRLEVMPTSDEDLDAIFSRFDD